MKLVFIFLWICLVTGFVAGCEDEIKEKMKLFVEGKDWKVLFKKYAQRFSFLEISVITNPTTQSQSNFVQKSKVLRFCVFHWIGEILNY